MRTSRHERHKPAVNVLVGFELYSGRAVILCIIWLNLVSVLKPNIESLFFLLQTLCIISMNIQKWQSHVDYLGGIVSGASILPIQTKNYQSDFTWHKDKSILLDNYCGDSCVSAGKKLFNPNWSGT